MEEQKSCRRLSSDQQNFMFLPKTPVVLHKITNLEKIFPIKSNPTLPMNDNIKLSYPIYNNDYILANISITTPIEKGSHRLSHPDLRRTTISEEVNACSISKTLNRRIRGLSESSVGSSFHAFMKSGYRCKLYFEPKETTAAIVTCGGLCPGLNSAIHSLVKTCLTVYRIKAVKGVVGGYGGFKAPMKNLTLDDIKEINGKGGSILKTNRGGFDIDVILERLRKERIDILFVIGGDGTHRAANKLFTAAAERGMKLAIACLPKSIDNDIGLIDNTFGFNTATEEAKKSIDSVVIEANSQPNCIGLVKIMGREAGFIASSASISSGEVDICLIPEVKFDLKKFGEKVRKYIVNKGKCVVVMSEGCFKSLEGVEDLLPEKEKKYDKGGNLILPGVEKFILKEIGESLKDLDYTVKFNSPKYMIRSVGANSFDIEYVNSCAQNAVHGAIAGFTGFTSASINRRMVMIPLILIDKCSPAQIDSEGKEIESLYNALN